MPDLFRPFKREKSLVELEEETEHLESEGKRLDAELSIAQKRAAIAQLKRRGLQPKHFGNTSQPSTWRRIWKWIKEH